MTEYEDLLASADDDYAHGRFKDAHITYGRAVAIGDGRNDHCRLRRGICSRKVAEERMDKAEEDRDLRQEFLNQAARWLAKSEANLDSAFDESPEPQLGHVRLEQARTEQAIARFMQMCGGDPTRRLANARALRDQGAELLGRA